MKITANLLAMIFLITTAGRAEERLTNDWMAALPEDVGLDSKALVEMFDFVKEREIPVHSVQIVRNGRLALDAYFHPYGPGMRHDVASVTKRITSTLVGLAVERGFLRDLNQPVVSLFEGPAIANLEARKRKLTLDHLLTRTTGTNALVFGRRELFAPLGIDDVVWPADARGYNHGWGDLQLHPRDMAKVGQLFLQRGRWKNRQVISEAWIQKATTAHVERTSDSDHYGYFWWVKGRDYPGMFEAVGRGGQRINVWPAKNLVLVFTGGGFEPGDLAGFIIKALKSDDPLPTNLEASTQLKQRLAAALKLPPARAVPKSPAMAAQISGKTFQLSNNAFNMKALSLVFDQRPEATEARAELFWEGQQVAFPLGLDGVERFAINPLLDLRQAAKGEWLDENIFLLSLDLVGGVNFYRVKVTFSEEGKKVKVALSERTGLNQAEFSGWASP